MKKIIVFTDGSCEGNGKSFACGGYGIYFPNKEYDDVSEFFIKSPVTNQRTELWAIYEALSTILNDKNNNYDEIVIYTDSEYSIKSLTQWSDNWIKNNWKNSKKQEVKNRDILEPLINLYNKNKLKIILIHVRSHTGKTDPVSLGNDMADKLAVDGSRKTKLLTCSNNIKHEKKPKKINKVDNEKKIIIDNNDIKNINRTKKKGKKN